ncbi:MFS transporter [Kocuria sp. JC486]|uniref:MFS transporter n=1 Tax=Kocuria sp. JC486 TaxID=1970736 RepID=UPI0024767C70|nr:MFS transporter [Kocuria sp. JC486]
MSPSARRALFAAVTGTLIEWYDYALYGAAAGLVIGPLFFAGTDTGATMAAFATFAVGFVARPLGGMVIGHMGDRYGRRPAMMLTIILMGLATVGIGLLPTSAVIGALAPVLLVVFRIIQGMGAGAELAGAMTIVSEFAPPKQRGLMTSFVLATPPAASCWPPARSWQFPAWAIRRCSPGHGVCPSWRRSCCSCWPGSSAATWRKAPSTLRR